MDAISYAHSAKQAQRIKKFIENPDSTSGIVTVPSTIKAGEIITIPAGRTAVLPDILVEGYLVVDGTVFIPSGSTFGDLESQIALKASIDSPIFTGNASVKNVNYKSTPVIITSWSYSGTTITLNVAPHTFVAGDYIEVSGLTTTTYPANGIHLVTSVTSTTIVFTLSATPTGTAGISSATVKGYATINGRISESIGVNQIFQSSGRSLGVTYTNTTGKPIYIMATISTSSTTAGATITINGVGFFTNINGTTTGANLLVSGIIPPSGTYSVSTTSGTLTSWGELR